MSQYLKVGNVITYNRAIWPTTDIVTNFLEAKYNQLHSMELTPWLYGSFLYNDINANDVDIWLIGQQPNWQTLENLFHELHDYALNVCKIKVDLKWVSIDIKDTIIRNPNVISEEKWIHNYFEHAQTSPCISTFVDDEYVWDKSNEKDWEKVSDYIIKGSTLNKPVGKKLYERLDKDGVLKHITVKDFLTKKS